MRIYLLSLALLSAPLMPHSQSAAAPADKPQALLNSFWRATTSAAQAEANSALMQATADVGTLYHWLKSGPEYSDDVPTGLINLTRVADDGTQFPYALRVPEHYDAQRAYPLEFNLHGGVNRPKIAAGESPWSERYESLSPPDSIVVVPVGWSDAYWWFDNQADNLPAILKSVKQRYNVDDNRVLMTGVSDGGTGSYFFAFMQPTEWAAFVPLIGSPGVLRNPRGRVSHPIAFDNLVGKPLYIVNSENDRLYPARIVLPHIENIKGAKADYQFTMIPNGGHNLDWMPEHRDKIDRFKKEVRRDPLPDSLQWTTTRTDRYNRNHWLRIDKLDVEGEVGRLIVTRQGNDIEIRAFSVAEFTLLLNPDEIDFDEELVVRVNNKIVYRGIAEQSPETLLHWAAKDRDRSMLFTAELRLSTAP